MASEFPPPAEWKLLGYLATGEKVYNDRTFHPNPEVDGKTLKAVLKRIHSGEWLSMEDTFIFNSNIGATNCVQTGENDEIVFTRRAKQCGNSRCVRNRQPEPTNKVTVALKRVNKESYWMGGHFYVITNDYYGDRRGLEPWDPRASEEDRKFWENHAFIIP